MISTDDPSKVLQGLQQAYLQRAVFTCDAHLTRNITANETQCSAFFMKLAFRRPRNIYMEWWEPKRKHLVVVASGNHVVEHSRETFEWRISPCIEDVLVRHAGISCGLSLLVPSLLLGFEGFTLMESNDIQMSRRIRNGETVIELSGCGNGGLLRTIIARPSDFTILNVQETIPFAGGVMQCETTYRDFMTGSMEEGVTPEWPLKPV